MQIETPDSKRPLIGQAELIAMVGLLMSLNAMAIDIFLPALDDIGEALGSAGNERQLIVSAYLIGFGVGQVFMGPLTDALGRRRVLIISISAYALTSFLCALSPSLAFLIFARFLQGLAAAGTRVVVTAVVRDLVSGRRMAQIMSFAMTVFMVAPLLAPALGELVLYVSYWRMIFMVLVAFSAVMIVWALLRLPETLPQPKRMPLDLGAAFNAYREVMQSRITMGYTAAAISVFAALYLFLATSEQVLAELYGLEHLFALAFAAISFGLAVTSLLNARFVRRFGMRRISHWGLVMFVLVNMVHALVAYFGDPPFWAFFLLLSLSTAVFATLSANFSAIVMEPAGDKAGTVGAFYGSTTSVFAALLGAIIGQFYNGSVFPIVVGYALLGLGGLALVFWTERGRLFGVGEAIGEAAESQN